MDHLSPQSIIEQMSSFYCAIYEFAQGSYPKTIWDNDVKLPVDQNSFRLSVVNTPTNFQLSILCSPPTIIQSFFESVQYIAMFIQILDYEARGFTRPIVLVFAYTDASVMESLMCLRRREFLDLADKLQKFSKDKFPEELRDYALELEDAIEKYGSENPGLVSKNEELKKILPQAGITKLEGKKTTSKEPDFFTQINNDLRPIESLINLKVLGKELIEFSKSLPTSHFQANVMAQSFSQTAGLGNQPELVLSIFTSDYSKEKLLVSSLDDKFQKILFSLLSGKTLVIVAKQVESAMSFAKRLAILTPFDNPLSYTYIPKCTSVAQILKYSIVVTSENKSGFGNTNNNGNDYDERDINNNNNNNNSNNNNSNLINDLRCAPFNIFYFEKSEYSGADAPVGSCVSRISPAAEAKSLNDNIFLITVYNNIKHTFSKFMIKIAELTARTRQTRERMLSALESFNFSPVDEPIFKYWIYSMASSSQNLRTILID